MKRLLVVDDEHELRNAIVDLIPWETYGYQVVAAVENGQAALTILTQHPIDLMITDLIMPKMDGLELIEAAKTVQPELNILILSNYSEFEYVKQALTLGAADYLLKASFSENSLAPLLLRFNENAPTTKISYSAEMQAKLLMTHPQLPQAEQQRFFAHFTTQTPLLLVAKATTEPEISKQALADYLKRLFPETLIVTLVVQKMYLFFIDTKATPQAIRRVINTNFQCQKELFFVATYIHLTDHLAETLREQIQPKFEFGFTLTDTQILFTDETLEFDTVPTFPKETFQHYFAVNDPSGGVEFLINHTRLCLPLTLTSAQVKEYLSYVLFTLINELEQLNFTTQELTLMKLEILHAMNDAHQQQVILTQFIERLQQLHTILRSREHAAHLPFHEISDYLYRNTHRQVTLKELADHFHYNYSYLSSLFTQVTQMNFTDYMTELKIQRAKDLLPQAGQTISEVAVAVGFTDISYFSKVFKKRTGQTPSQYKRGLDHD